MRHLNLHESPCGSGVCLHDIGFAPADRIVRNEIFENVIK